MLTRSAAYFLPTTSPYFPQNGMPPEATEILANLVANSKGRLSRLDLSHNGFDESCAAAFGAALASTNTLRLLDVSADGAVSLGAAEMHAASATMRSEGFRSLVLGLARNTSLTALHVAGHGIRDEGCRSIAHALLSSPNLRHLNLRDNRIGDKGAAELTQIMAQLCQARPRALRLRVDLSGNRVGDLARQTVEALHA